MSIQLEAFLSLLDSRWGYMISSQQWTVNPSGGVSPKAEASMSDGPFLLSFISGEI